MLASVTSRSLELTSVSVITVSFLFESVTLVFYAYLHNFVYGEFGDIYLYILLLFVC